MAPASQSSWTSGLTFYFAYALLTATIGPLLFGYHLAELNAPQAVITCRSDGPVTDHPVALPQCIPMNQVEIGLVNSMFTLGGFIGALSAGPAAAKYGRLITMRLNTFFFMLGPIGEALAPSVAVLATGRLISGIGAGAAVVVSPIFVSEISPPARKGFFGAFTQVMINFGIFLAQLLGLFLSKGQLWRIILGVGGAFGLLQLLGLIFATESPKWMAEQGDGKKARGILQQLRGSEYDIKEEFGDWQLGGSEPYDGEEQSLLQSEHSGLARESDPRHFRKQPLSILQVIAHPDTKRATLSVMVIMVAQQFCGINSIVFYGVSLLSDLLDTSAALLNCFVALVNLVVTIACAPLVDKLGRKPCLIASTLGMGISAMLLGIAILVHLPTLSVVAVSTFVGSFGIGLGSVPFLIASELVGPTAIGATQSWALAANWVATFIVAQFFPIVNRAMGKGKIYFVFTGIAAAFATFVFFFVPETKGKKDADEVWGRSRGERRIYERNR